MFLRGVIKLTTSSELGGLPVGLWDGLLSENFWKCIAALYISNHLLSFIEYCSGSYNLTDPWLCPYDLGPFQQD